MHVCFHIIFFAILLINMLPIFFVADISNVTKDAAPDCMLKSHFPSSLTPPSSPSSRAARLCPCCTCSGRWRPGRRASMVSQTWTTTSPSSARRSCAPKKQKT
jgi:hypothetical protein